MKLNDYIVWKQLSKKVVAKDLKISRQRLWEIINKNPPGRKLAMRIVDWSDGQVRFEDLWNR